MLLGQPYLLATAVEFGLVNPDARGQMKILHILNHSTELTSPYLKLVCGYTQSSVKPLTVMALV